MKELNELPANAQRIFKAILELAGDFNIVSVSKYELMKRVAVSDPLYPVKTLESEGFLKKLEIKGKNNANVYKILKRT